MSHIAIYRAAKICSPQKLKMAVEHNKRENAREIANQPNIDPARSHQNWSLLDAETSREALARVNARLKKAQVRTVRVDAVRCIELLFSLPSDHRIDARRFFADCLAWAASEFGGIENVIAADVHLDEGNEHCHILILPLVDGRMNGSRLFGFVSVLSRRLTSFYSCVAEQYGFDRPLPALKGAKKLELAQKVLAAMKADPARQSVLWEGILASIYADPERFASLLGLRRGARKPKKMRTMAQIFTSPGKGPTRHPGSDMSESIRSASMTAPDHERAPHGASNDTCWRVPSAMLVRA